MYHRRRMTFSKWTGIVLAVFLLSQGIARWRTFFQSPTIITYFALTLVLTLFLLLMLVLAVVVYAEEKGRGNIRSPRPWFERWANRFFLVHQDSSRG